MTTDNSHLPKSNSLDIAALSRIFKSTTNSYKYLFFLSILNKLESKPWPQGDPVIIPLEDLAVEMALLSWYPVKFFKLSFGLQDKVTEILDRFIFDPSFKAITSSLGQNQLRSALEEQALDIGLFALLQDAPYRLQTPFFADRLRGVTDYKKPDLISELANEYNSSVIPLYSFSTHNKRHVIKIHDKWINYFLQNGNIRIVRDWSLWEWVNYLQRRNPNTPAIINKVLPPIKRSSLNTQTSFWKTVIEADSNVECIYSGEKLADKAFTLDHFLPWTFVCHDQAWNLCPVTKPANSSKGNQLPANRYVEAFIQQQIDALKVSNTAIPPSNWRKLTESYSVDLHLEPELLLDKEAVYEAYRRILKPMISLAGQTGFEKDWSFRT